jgi:hypothetical protein
MGEDIERVYRFRLEIAHQISLPQAFVAAQRIGTKPAAAAGFAGVLLKSQV